MADWKSDKNLGPWPFVSQPNKWGYLNNPRWQTQSRPFVKGGPDDYDGHESEEPQIWSIDRPNIVQTNPQPSHNLCGHWHKGKLLPGSTEGELDQNVTVTFKVYGSKPSGIVYHGNCFYPHPSSWPPESSLNAWEGEFWYSDDDGATYTAVPDTYHTFSILTPFPWYFSIPVDPALWSVAGRKFYVHYRGNGGGWVLTWLNFYWNPALTYTYGVFWVETVDYPYGEANSILIMRWQAGITTDVIQPLDVALFDRDTNEMISGSEIHFTTEELKSEKFVVIPNGVFPFNHEVEVRAKSAATAKRYAPYLQEASIYVDYEDIENFVSYQRIGTGSLLFGWGYGGNYDESPYPWNGQEQYLWEDPTQDDLWTESHPPDDGFPGGYYRYGGIDASARQLVHKISGMQIKYQTCVESYRSVDFPYDPIYDAPVEYIYQALWDNDTTDNGYTSGSKVLSASKLAITLAELSEWQKRYLKTTGDISSHITNDNRYCQFQPADQNPIYPIGAALLGIVSGVAGTPMDLPDTFIYLIACSSYATKRNSPNPVTPPLSFRPWDPNKYDGTIQSWFEVSYANHSAGEVSITVVDIEGNVYATLALPVTLPEAGWPWQLNTVRVEFSLPTEAMDLGFSITSAGAIGGVYIKTACIRIRQLAATKSRVHIPMLLFNMDWGMVDTLESAYLGASAAVITNGQYLANFDNPDYLDGEWSWALDAGNIVKLG